MKCPGKTHFWHRITLFSFFHFVLIVRFWNRNNEFPGLYHHRPGHSLIFHKIWIFQKRDVWVFVLQKCGKFWSIFLEYFLSERPSHFWRVTTVQTKMQFWNFFLKLDLNCDHLNEYIYMDRHKVEFYLYKSKKKYLWCSSTTCIYAMASFNLSHIRKKFREIEFFHFTIFFFFIWTFF